MYIKPILYDWQGGDIHIYSCDLPASLNLIIVYRFAESFSSKLTTQIMKASGCCSLVQKFFQEKHQGQVLQKKHGNYQTILNGHIFI